MKADRVQAQGGMDALQGARTRVVKSCHFAVSEFGSSPIGENVKTFGIARKTDYGYVGAFSQGNVRRGCVRTYWDVILSSRETYFSTGKIHLKVVFYFLEEM